MIALLKTGRRRFLATAVQASALLAMPVGVRAAWHQGAGDPVAGSLVRLLRCRESAVVIGRSYLCVMHCEVNESELVERICCGSGFTPQVLRSRERGRSWLQKRVRSDFETGNTVRVNGWILAETEANLCALASLRQT